MAVEAVRATTTGEASYVEWGAVFGGAVAALAVSLVLLAFGAAIGLSSVSPWTATGTTFKAIGLGAAVWLLLVTIWSSAMGGYLAGRLRHRWGDATAVEMKFRDSAHGLLVWSVAVLLAAVFAASGVSAVGRGLATAAANAPVAIDATSVATDSLLRSTKPATAQSADVRGEVNRILVRSGRNGEVSADDRAYLASIVAANTGLSQADAEKRVTDTLDQMKAALDRARKVGIVLGFLTASILLIGAATSWWAAAVGGKHREEGTLWHGFA